MSDDNVFRLVDVKARAPDPEDEPTPATVLQLSAERDLSAVLVLGYTLEGTMWVSSSGNVTRQDALWLVENAKMQIMFGEDDDE
jgi:hypothetical protein